MIQGFHSVLRVKVYLGKRWEQRIIIVMTVKRAGSDALTFPQTEGSWRKHALNM